MLFTGPRLLVLRAYEVWGEESASRLLGDFAFVIWDGARRQLFAARDALGTRTIFYYWNGRTCVIGSEYRQIFINRFISREVDTETVRDFLHLSFGDVERTFYQQVRRLPPGNTLTIRDGRLRVRRYWDINPDTEIRYRTLEEYSAHFCVLFREAVRCRLRGVDSAGCLFSGGLDSSSILCAALAESRATNAAPIQAFSMVFDEAPIDDREFIGVCSTHVRQSKNGCAT